MFAPCINDNLTFYYPTNAQYIICRYSYNYKLFRSAATCFGSQRIHHQGALYSAWLKITRRKERPSYTVNYTHAQCHPIQWTTHTHSATLYSELHTRTVPPYTVNCTHAQQITIFLCCHNTDLVHVNGHDRTILVIFSQALYKAPWRWILCDPKHVGALLNSL